MKNDLKLGVIGVGIMGSAIARKLLSAGYSPTVYDIRPAPMKKLIKLGVTASESPCEVAKKTDIIFIAVPDSPDVEEVMLGKSGVIEGAREGLTVIVTSNISPLVIQQVAEKARNKGVRMLDAGLTGGEKGAREGTLAIFVGGKETLFKECLPILKILGDKLFYIGPTGCGLTLKMVNNLMAYINLQALCEGLILGMKSGLEPEKMIEALNAGSFNSNVMNGFSERILQRRFKPPSAKLSNAHKTLRIILDMASQADLPLPAGSTVYQLMTSMKATGKGNLDMSALITVLEDMADFEASVLAEE